MGIHGPSISLKQCLTSCDSTENSLLANSRVPSSLTAVAISKPKVAIGVGQANNRTDRAGVMTLGKVQAYLLCRLRLLPSKQNKTKKRKINRQARTLKTQKGNVRLRLK